MHDQDPLLLPSVCKMADMVTQDLQKIGESFVLPEGLPMGTGVQICRPMLLVKRFLPVTPAPAQIL